MQNIKLKKRKIRIHIIFLQTYVEVESNNTIVHKNDQSNWWSKGRRQNSVGLWKGDCLLNIKKCNTVIHFADSNTTIATHNGTTLHNVLSIPEFKYKRNLLFTDNLSGEGYKILIRQYMEQIFSNTLDDFTRYSYEFTNNNFINFYEENGIEQLTENHLHNRLPYETIIKFHMKFTQDSKYSIIMENVNNIKSNEINKQLNYDEYKIREGDTQPLKRQKSFNLKNILIVYRNHTIIRIYQIKVIKKSAYEFIKIVLKDVKYSNTKMEYKFLRNKSETISNVSNNDINKFNNKIEVNNCKVNNENTCNIRTKNSPDSDSNVIIFEDYNTQ
ncbi:hypothetical protein H8356DRAFT_1329106 [Neocallimastix lanati (nom. inval.)]|nr:hypothetical protein H8356DRAFT_1329106 [Neocallimastix sp. JGI-2020a]